MIRHTRRKLFATALAASMFATSIVPTAYANDQQPDSDPLTTLLSEYSTYWQPGTVDADGTATGGTVLNPGVLGHNDTITVAINNAAASGTADVITEQQQRALRDSDDKTENVPAQFADALGPVLGGYFVDGYRNGELAQVFDVMNSTGRSTSPAKAAYAYPRPYTNRATWISGQDDTAQGKNNLAGLADTLNIIHVPDANSTGQTANYVGNYGQGSFPSGHTSSVYSRGVALAVMLPQLAPEILARTSEAGNNRIVLGVHYALDVMGGRIAGTASNAAYWETNAAKVQAASQQLQTYLTQRCAADGYGSTLADCIANTGAGSDKGYTNDFVDTVVTKPVTDRASALAAYTARMTYNFQPAGNTRAAFTAPEGAAALLTIAYPTLTVAQRNAVLAATAITSGYPLDASSQGWLRINLARALSSTVTLSEQGEVIAVADADAPSVQVQHDNNNQPGNNNNQTDTDNTTTDTTTNNNAAAKTADLLADTGVASASSATALLVLTLAGVTVLAVRRRAQR